MRGTGRFTFKMPNIVFCVKFLIVKSLNQNSEGRYNIFDLNFLTLDPETILPEVLPLPHHTDGHRRRQEGALPHLPEVTGWEGEETTRHPHPTEGCHPDYQGRIS